MNKTLITIAWICLVLGLLGTAADAGILIYGGKLIAERRTAFETLQGRNQTGNAAIAKNMCIAVDADKDGKPDGDCLQHRTPGQPGAGMPAFGRLLFQRGMHPGMRGGFAGQRTAFRGILPLFFLALGPVLLVVGAVMLLVNRTPKDTASQVKKEAKEDKEVKETKAPTKK
jgi:hypothetical protein